MVENSSHFRRVGHFDGLRRSGVNSRGRSLRRSRFPARSQTYACAEAKGTYRLKEYVMKQEFVVLVKTL